MCGECGGVERAGLVTQGCAAEETKGFLAAIVESSDDAIIACTPAGILRSWNRGAEALFGWSAGEAIGMPLSMLVAPERLPLLPSFMDRALQGNAVPQHEGVTLHKNGRRIHVAVTASAIRDATGEPVAISLVIRDITERREAEKTRALLASIVESSDSAIMSAALDGTILSWNESAEKLYGYSAGEIIGRNGGILIPFDRRHEFSELLDTIRSGSTSHLTTIRQARDGRQLDVALAVSPVRNAAGEIVGMSVAARDAGERVRAERALQESEERFRGVFENAPFGMCAHGLDGRFTQVNAAFCRMVGYSERELLSKAWIELSHPDDRDADLKRGQRLLGGLTESVDVERRYMHRGGNEVWGRVRVSLVRDSAGRPSYSVVHVEDITKRKRSEEALRESEDRFRIMADSCPTMMWVTDAQGGNEFINRAYRDFAGTTCEQVEGGNWRLPVHPDDAPGYAAAFRRAVEEHTPFWAEARVRRADGEWRWLGSHATPRLSLSGEYLGHVGLSSDITAHAGRAGHAGCPGVCAIDDRCAFFPHMRAG